MEKKTEKELFLKNDTSSYSFSSSLIMLLLLVSIVILTTVTWNASVPHISGLGPISFTQAGALLILLRIISSVTWMPVVAMPCLM
jgi:hypothetical protein